MDRLAIEFICPLGMPPVQFVELAAKLGVRRIGMAPGPITANPYGFDPWNIVEDAALRRDTAKALADNGVTVSVGEGFLIMQGMEIAASEPVADALAELGAPLINCIVMEQDRARANDEFNQLAGMAAARGMDLSLEFMPLMWPIALDEAQAFVKDTGAANARLMVDAMHFYRSGASTGDLARIDPALIGYVQLCDVPMPARTPDYGMEARDNRLCPGEGDLPLGEFVAALPENVTMGIEAPMVAKASTGIDPESLLRPCVEAARRLLS